jgi:hypothetical protein
MQTNEQGCRRCANSYHGTLMSVLQEWSWYTQLRLL